MSHDASWLKFCVASKRAVTCEIYKTIALPSWTFQRLSPHVIVVRVPGSPIWSPWQGHVCSEGARLVQGTRTGVVIRTAGANCGQL